MRQPWTLDGLRAAAAIARLGTPLRAARTLACAPSSIYRAIDRLERDIGRPLFERAPAGWEATPVGREVVALAERLEAELAAAELRLMGNGGITPAVIRVSASDGLAGWFLAPILADFVRDKPAVTIELLSDNAFADLAHREADIAVRPDRKPGDDLIGRRASKLAHALYGAEQLLTRLGTPRTLADLGRFDICGMSAALQHFTAVRWAKGPAAGAIARVPLVFNSETALTRAVACGAGLGVLPCFIGRQLPGVRRIPDLAVGEPVDIWLVTHRAMRGNPQIGALMRHLVSAFRRDAAAFV